MTYRAPDLAPYTPVPALDTELADLGYDCVRGFADQRPITPSLVRSRLAEHRTATHTMLATYRSSGDRTLIGAAALRPPAAPGGTGRLWGPLVRPGHRRRGLGRRLLIALTPALRSMDGTVTTTEIPNDRPGTHTFFQTAGWGKDLNGATLWKALLPLTSPTGPPPTTVRCAQPDEDLTRIDALYAAARPGDRNAARAGDRWRSDERFRNSCLTFADDGDRLLAAALVYPLAHTHPEESAEALLGDLLLHPDAHDRSHLALHAARWALTAAAHAAGATIARTVVDDRDTTALRLVQHLGFTKRATIRYYQPPQPEEALG
ncbi:GNAT family N-acetyltransferase [Streptomyces sp. TR02-1]|uniref:GNAT family N-acetyltransferase n=1 Tax=Streptomyces sp. TR02-1 TaxID=3385977 RepID=UPI00399F6DA8